MNRKNKSEKRTLGEKIVTALDIPSELLPRKTLVEIHGSSLVKIQGAGGILLYTENEIRISLREKGSFLCVLGHGLCCNSYNMGAVGIEGRIRSVSFCHGEKEEENER